MRIYTHPHTHIHWPQPLNWLEDEEPFLITSLSQPPTADLAVLGYVHQYKTKKNHTVNQSVIAAPAPKRHPCSWKSRFMAKSHPVTGEPPRSPWSPFGHSIPNLGHYGNGLHLLWNSRPYCINLKNRGFNTTTNFQPSTEGHAPLASGQGHPPWIPRPEVAAQTHDVLRKQPFLALLFLWPLIPDDASATKILTSL